MRIALSSFTALIGLLLSFIIMVHRNFNVPQGRKLEAYKYVLSVLGSHLSIVGICLLVTLIVFVISWYLVFNQYPVGRRKVHFKGQKFKKSLRGSTMVAPDELKKLTIEPNAKINQVTIGGVPMPIHLEGRHALMVGATGTGKTVAIREIINGIVPRGSDKLFIVDPNGDMLSKFYEEGDYILNPHDTRTQGWSIFNEIRNSYDFERFTWSLVPEAKGEQETWNGYARLLLESVLLKMYEHGNYDMAEVFNICTIYPLPDLKAFLEDTKGYSIVAGDEGETPTIRSTRFVLTKYLSKHMEMPNGDFSIRKWLEDGKANKLFVTWREDLSTQMKPLISAWTDVCFSSILSLEEDERRRVWAFLDELPSLEFLTNLEAALTKGRKHGLRVVAGLQSTAQLDDIYGQDKAQTLRASFRSMLALGGSSTDSKTAETVSLNLGEHEVLRLKSSKTAGTTTSVNRSEVRERERIVLPSEITGLEDLTGYLRFAGNYPITKIKLVPLQLPEVTKGFIEKISLVGRY